MKFDFREVQSITCLTCITGHTIKGEEEKLPVEVVETFLLVHNGHRIMVNGVK